MADISGLGALQAVEPLDLENYADNKGTFNLPPKGEYTLRAAPEFPSTAFGRAQSGAITASVDPVIVEGQPGAGLTLKFTRVSGKQFKRGGVLVSQMGDYLRSCGIRGRLADEQAQADAVEQTANRVFKAELDWRAYNKETGYSVEGMEKFPSDGQGGHQSWIEDPLSPKGEDGKGMRLRANLFIRRYIAAS